jgi:hypothetical protein
MAQQKTVIVRLRDDPSKQMHLALTESGVGVISNNGMEMLIVEAYFAEDCQTSFKPKDDLTKSIREALSENNGA